MASRGLKKVQELSGDGLLHTVSDFILKHLTDAAPAGGVGLPLHLRRGGHLGGRDRLPFGSDKFYGEPGGNGTVWPTIKGHRSTPCLHS